MVELNLIKTNNFADKRKFRNFDDKKDMFWRIKKDQVITRTGYITDWDKINKICVGQFEGWLDFQGD